MIPSKFTSLVSRVLSVATVLTLVGFAASVDLQPQSALASPGASAEVSTGVIAMADDTSDNGDENRKNNDENRNHDGNNNDENRNNNDENRNHDEHNNGENRENNNHENNHENHEQHGNTGGEGIFSTICSVPGFANNVGCSSGLLGS
jgi:hypothetical protein